MLHGSRRSDATGDTCPRFDDLSPSVIIAGFAVQALGLATSFLEAEVGHGYYNQQFDYRLGYNALAMQVELLLKYLSSHEPVRIGLGFDRWFVFLGKGGVSHATLLAFGLVMAGCAVLPITALLRCVHSESASPAPIHAVSTSAS